MANLYFVINDLGNIEPTYQWSLEFYIRLFLQSIQMIKEMAIEKNQKVDKIIEQFQLLLYESICRSLLEKDKIIFSFLLCLKIMETEKKISSEEVAIFFKNNFIGLL